jgi:CheY-like chemotaxis protein
VLDLGLPDVDGLEIIRTARALPDPPAVVVFTGHHRLKADAEAAGCDVFIPKPDLDPLLARLAVIAAKGQTTARKTS